MNGAGGEWTYDTAVRIIKVKRKRGSYWYRKTGKHDSSIRGSMAERALLPHRDRQPGRVASGNRGAGGGGRENNGSGFAKGA